jgi:alkanesulfonate monooxygenase SsuD/methylene tetrahydromethanopterin reductase-like flavin-dependent oxidoreductase (luciferase family)
MAAAAWDLGLWSGGRFVLGLGSQVGPTLAARFGVSADHPGPRMRDYIRAVRACFQAFRSGRGGYEGEYYTIRRPAFQPGADGLESDPAIYLGAVNPYMSGVAGEVAEGLAAHPFSTPEYLRDVVRPALAGGADRAGRAVPPVLLQLLVAPTRQAAAAQMLAYTVPAYRRVLDHAGLGEVADRVMAAARDGRREEARRLIDDGYLDRLGVVIGDELAEGVERWRGLAERITLSVPWFGTGDADQLRLADRLIRQIRDLR